MYRIAPKNRMESGQSLVEFAVSAIVILLLLVAVADFGRAFFTYLSMRDAAQEGASFGSICPMHYDQIISRVRNTGNLPVSLVDPIEVPVVCNFWFDFDGNQVADEGETWACNSGYVPDPGTGIQITIEYPHFVITTPLLGSIIGNEISLRAEVTDTILRVVDPGDSCP
jgi:hypothetical protein